MFLKVLSENFSKIHKDQISWEVCLFFTLFPCWIQMELLLEISELVSVERILTDNSITSINMYFLRWLPFVSIHNNSKNCTQRESNFILISMVTQLKRTCSVTARSTLPQRCNTSNRVLTRRSCRKQVQFSVTESRYSQWANVRRTQAARTC